MGQVSGIIFIVAMDAMKDKSTGSMTTPILILAALVAGAAVLATVLGESPVAGKREGGPKAAG